MLRFSHPVRSVCLLDSCPFSSSSSAVGLLLLHHYFFSCFTASPCFLVPALRAGEAPAKCVVGRARPADGGVLVAATNPLTVFGGVSSGGKAQDLGWRPRPSGVARAGGPGGDSTHGACLWR